METQITGRPSALDFGNRPDVMEGGFYIPRAGGSVAFVQDLRSTRGEPDTAMTVLLHEYAHHFMLENFPTAYPAWFVEGWAEYFMTAEINGAKIKVGGFNPARAYGVLGETWLPLEQVLSKTTSETDPERRNVYYAQSWLLMHYMLNRFNGVMRDLLVHEANMARNMNKYGGIVFSQRVLLTLVDKGAGWFAADEVRGLEIAPG